MILSRLRIQTLRNLTELEIEPCSQLNCLMGVNGSGKTSILEAIHLLGLGRSFRASQLNRVIQHGTKELLIFAELKEPAAQAASAKIGFSKDLQGKTRIKHNGDPLHSLAELAELLPVLLLYTESYTLFRDSPGARRKWLDWGMFHVEPRFFPLWKKLHRVIQQRNILLKQGASDQDIKVWDQQLIEWAEAIHLLRTEFVAKWQLAMSPILRSLFDREDLVLSYSSGWDLELGLAAHLARSLSRDRMMGHTTRGPHRADIQIYINGIPAQHTLSLGQQKLLVSGIVLSQAVAVQQLAGKSPLLLIDDLPAELDEAARERIAAIIHTLDAQIFLTGIDRHTLDPFISHPGSKMFHVEHGSLSLSLSPLASSTT